MKKIGIGLAIAVLLIFSFPTQVNAGPKINPDWLKLKLLPGILTTPTLEPEVTPTITPVVTEEPTEEEVIAPQAEETPTPTPTPGPQTNIWQLATIALGAAIVGAIIVLLVSRLGGKKPKKEEEKPKEEEE